MKKELNKVEQQLYDAALKECRYYKGEEECPYDGTDNKAILWTGERSFVNGYTHGTGGEFVDACTTYQYYVNSKLPAKGCELQRNAVLFNMYCKGCYSVADSVDKFVEFIKQSYK